MKGGGGLTWLGWALVGVGGMLMYAGMTGQSLTAEIAAVLNGRSPKQNAPAPSTPGGNGESGMTDGSAGSGVGGSSSGGLGSSSYAVPNLPNPTYTAPGGSGSW